MTADPPFRHLSDRIVHRGHLWRVAVATFESPDGDLFERDLVRSPGAVGVVPVIDEDGEPTVVLVRQYRGAFDRFLLEIPAGMRDVADEPPDLTARRELAEEVGLSPGRLEHLTEFYPSAGMNDATLHLYLATDLTVVPREAHGPEESHMEVVQIPLAKAVEMVTSGAIEDAKTVIGLLLVERRRHEGSLLLGP